MTPLARVEALVELAAALGDPADALGARARTAAVLDGALSPPMADWALRTAALRYTPDAVASCVRSPDLGGREVAVVLSASVATAPLRAVALALLRGASRVLVRPARARPRFAALLVEALAARGAPVELRPDPEAPAAFLTEALARGIRAFLAYGSDETLRAVQGDLPEGVLFEGRGHGFGVLVVRAEAADDPATLDAVARDVAHFDQHGCLSPQAVFLEKADPARFAAGLSSALAQLALELPRGPLEPEIAARVHQWQGALAARAAAFYRGAAHSVAALAEPALASSPGARNIAVVPLGALAELRPLLQPEAAHLTCVGVGVGARAAHDPLELPLPRDAMARVVSAGTMQDPPLDGPEDPRAPTAYAPGAPRR